MLMWCENSIVFVISQVEVMDIKRQNPLQLWSYCVYPLREVRSDQFVVEVPQDNLTSHRASQRQDLVRQN